MVSVIFFIFNMDKHNFTYDNVGIFLMDEELEFHDQ